MFARYRLELFRTEVQEAAERKMGTYLSLGKISVNGFRGFRIESVEAFVETSEGPTLYLNAPAAYVHLDIGALLRGTLQIERVVLDDASLRVERPEGSSWFSPELFSLTDRFGLDGTAPFRVTGKNCTLDVGNIVSGTRLPFKNFSFDISRLVEATDVAAKVEGNLGGDFSKHFALNFHGGSMDDFIFRIEVKRFTADDVNVFFPASEEFVLSGESRPSIRVAGYPDRTFTVSVKAPFEDLTIRDQPDFLKPSTGEMTMLATYNLDSHILAITTAQAESDQVGGAISGTISFSEEVPRFDLRLEASRLPVTEMVNYALEGLLDDYGTMGFSIEEPYEVLVTLQGDAESPLLRAMAQADAGEVSMLPSNIHQPQGRLKLGKMEAFWDSSSKAVGGSFVIEGGNMVHEDTGIQARNIRGLVTIADGQVRIDPLTAIVTDHSFVGSGMYDIENDYGEISFSGIYDNLELTSISGAIKDLTVSGSVNLTAKAIKDGNRYVVTGDVDATQTHIGYQWWLEKHEGVGASGHIQLEYRPEESLVVEYDGDVASSLIHVTGIAQYTGRPDEPWELVTLNATSDHLDLNGLGRCTTAPYKITGGIGTDCRVTLVRDPKVAKGWRVQAEANFDDIQVQAISDELTEPIHCKDLMLRLSIDDPVLDAVDVSLIAREGIMPSFGVTWFVPFLPPEKLAALYPPTDRQWRLHIKTDRLKVLPWRGTNFVGEAYFENDKGGLHSFSADVDDGYIEGSYHNARADNSYTMSANWQAIPSKYFLEHLKYPDVFTGSMTGEVAYSLDRDDPSTLSGQGKFLVSEGEFSADFVLDILEEKIESAAGALPASLKFATLEMAVEFDGDAVITRDVHFDSDSIDLDGTGRFIHDGDMDYDLAFKISPTLAERIPLIREYFPVQGHLLARQDIELAFKVVGPTFRPRGQVAKLPSPSVTLVSGALELVSEARNVIDIPRRILLDLLKTVGGLVGATTN